MTQPHWHVAINRGFGHIIPEKAIVYWVLNDAWAEMTRGNKWGQWTMVECKDLECVLREMT